MFCEMNLANIIQVWENVHNLQPILLKDLIIYLKNGTYFNQELHNTFVHITIQLVLQNLTCWAWFLHLYEVLEATNHVVVYLGSYSCWAHKFWYWSKFLGVTIAFSFNNPKVILSMI